VFKGVDVMLEREVAIKMLRPELARNPQIVERFRTEAVTLAKLNHPYIATLYSFIRQGIPSLALKLGYDKGSPEEKVVKTWLAERYHAPSDDLQQPVDREAAGKFDRLVAALLMRVANEKQRPEWRSTSFFKRFASQ